MRRLIRKLAIGTASILALGIAGAALDYAADAGNAANTSKMPPGFETSRYVEAGANLWKDDIRWAQVELRFRGLYNGSLDGVVGPKTELALGRFQRNKGLDRTATLDAQTLQALTGSADIGQGSSTPPASVGTRSMTTAAGTNN